MRHLFSGYVLLAAWLIVLGALGAGLSYSLLLPFPPPTAEPASTAMPAVYPEFAPPGRSPELGESAETAPLPDTPQEAVTAAEEEPAAVSDDHTAKPEEPQEEPGAADPVAVAQPPAEPAAPEDPEKPGSAETPRTAGETKDPDEPAGDSKSVSIPLPKPETPATALDAEGKTPLEQAGEKIAVPATTSEGEAGSEPESELAVQVPIVPPAPEELPYWERYRQPFNTADPRPRIAVVLTGLGLSDSATQAAIDKLPAAITLSFSPYARGLERWIALARARGHEVMLDLPMEPTTFPNEDPGPQALLTGLSAEDNLDRLDWVLSRGSAYVGVAGAMGSRFTASRQQMETVLKELKSRGLIFLDNRTTEKSVAAIVASEIGLQNAFNNRSIDERQASRLAIDARLAQIERIALSEGFAVAMAQPYPVTLDRLVEWSTELTARGYAIAPISALINRQERR